MPKGASDLPLSEAMRTQYRSNVMRLAYLSHDRPDLQFTSKELARATQSPIERDWNQLKHAVRYLVGAPRIVQRFYAQTLPKHVQVFTDSDHAGCIRTRKSTSGVYIFFGKHLIRSSSTTQGVIALSSGESEFYSMVKGCSAGLGANYLLKDAGCQTTAPLELTVDATAGIGIASRKGAGRIRHIATPTLWLQRLVNDGSVVLS